MIRLFFAISSNVLTDQNWKLSQKFLCELKLSWFLSDWYLVSNENWPNFLATPLNTRATAPNDLKFGIQVSFHILYKKKITLKWIIETFPKSKWCLDFFDFAPTYTHLNFSIKKSPVLKILHYLTCCKHVPKHQKLMLRKNLGLLLGNVT
jgi:hypothetical protein